MACKIKATNGKLSNLAKKLSTVIADEAKVDSTYFKTKLPEFEMWYGDAKRDANNEPVLQKMKDGALAFVNGKGESMGISLLNATYPDSPNVDSVDPANVLTEEEIELLASQDPQRYEELKLQLDTEKFAISEIRKRLIKKKNRFENSKAGATKVSQIATLLEQLDKLNTKTAIYDYFTFALTESRRMLSKVEKSIEGGGDLQEMASALDYASAFDNLTSVYDVVKDMFVPGADINFNRDYFEQYIGPTMANIDRIKYLYGKASVGIVAEKLIQYNRDSTLTIDDVKLMLMRATNDINFLSYAMDAMAESDDQVLALVDRAVKDSRNKLAQEMTQFKEGEYKERLLELEQFQKAKGINVANNNQLYDFMLKKETGPDGKSRLTGEYMSAEEVLKEVKSKDDPRYKFAQMYEQMYLNALSHLPNNYSVRVGAIPTILKTNAEVAVEQGLGTAAKEGFKDATTMRVDETEFGDIQVYTDDNGNRIKFVPVHFVQQVGWNDAETDAFQVQPDQLSTNLGNSLLQFMTMAKNYSSMQELVPTLEATKNLLATRDVEVQAGIVKRYIDKGLAKDGIVEVETKTGINTNAYKMLNEYMDAHVYGEFRIDAGTIDLGNWKIDGNKLSDALMKYTAVNSLGLNLLSGAANFTMGTIMNGIEASSSMFFSSQDFKGAMKEYSKSIPGFLKDASGRFTESELGLFMETFDLFQEFNEFGTKIEHKNGLLRNGNKALYFMQNSGEHFIQTTHALAMAKGHRIMDGKILSYFEWLDATGNKRGKESKKQFKELPSVFDSKELVEVNRTMKAGNDTAAGVDYKAKEFKIKGVSQEEALAFAERIKGNYQHNHGNYARQDAPNINRRWWGKMLMLFRKWLKPGINRRFSKEYFDQRLGHKYSGNYNVTAKFMMSLMKDIKQVGLGFVLYWNTPQYQQLSEWEKSQITKTFSEIMLIAGSAILANFLHGLREDEDEEIWALSFSEFLANRVYQEIFTFTNPSEAFKTLRSPTATLSSLEKALTALQSLVFWERYKSGENKDELKFIHQGSDMIPVWNQFATITGIDEIIKFQRK